MSTSVAVGVAVDAVADVINQFVSKDRVFSAYDVTQEIRKSGDVRHYDVKGKVHGLYMSGQLGNNLYSRELVQFDLGRDLADVFVYFPHSKSAYDHPLAKKQTVQVPVDADGEVQVIVTDEHRIQIPQEILKQVTVTSTNEYNVSCDGKNHFCTANADGRIRITETSFPVGAKLSITVKDDTIQISPV